VSLGAGEREVHAPRGSCQAASGFDILVYVYPESCIFSWNLCFFFSLTFTKQAWGGGVGSGWNMFAVLVLEQWFAYASYVTQILSHLLLS
jgi:hypothetical protein